MSSIWEVLSAIDCNEHVEKKGQFSYLSWTWAWAMVKQNYPYANYELLEDTIYPDGTMEVRVRVSISRQVSVDAAKHAAVFNTLSHTMWLPVLDFKNKAIQNPNAFDVNSARMRCLVKCLAMFGLGHYIYAGESAPQEASTPAPTEEQKDEFYGLVAQDNGFGLMDFRERYGQDIMDSLFNMAPQGQKTAVKNKCREAYGNAVKSMKATVQAIEEAIAAGRPADTVVEIMEELEPLEKKYVVGAFDEVLARQVSDLLEEA